MPSPITTHVLDTSQGRPAAGIGVELFRLTDDDALKVGNGQTDSDGRVTGGLIQAGDFRPGVYRIRFATQDYFQQLGCESFYPEVSITFVVAAGEEHYHVPLLLSPFGYSTYRGS